LLSNGEMEGKSNNTHGKEELESAVPKSARHAFWKSVRKIVHATLSIKAGTDAKGTIEEVKKNIVFKGPTVWILICSILIASIGLNVNSTAVIIGAMLISPLMGPIIGVGLSVGINDVKLLKRSFKNYGVMVGISLITSSIYFYLTPLSQAQSELFARTQPTLLHVLVALFGGMAGIIAGSRDEKSNVIPGVAIATALMPPLCTAGYGLATFNVNFFLGAFYLFLLNSVFILLSTVIIVSYLRFPHAKYEDEKVARRVRRWISVLALVIIIPSIVIFWSIVQESVFKGKAEDFIHRYMNFDNTEIVSRNIVYTDSVSLIEVFLIGEIIPENKIEELNKEMRNFGIENTRLKINQATDESKMLAGKLSEAVKAGIIEDLYKRNEEIIKNKDQQIAFLENQLLAYKSHEIPFEDIQHELRPIFENIEHFSYAKMVEGDYASPADTIFTILVKWDSRISLHDQAEDNFRLSQYLKARLKLDTVKVIPMQ